MEGKIWSDYGSIIHDGVPLLSWFRTFLTNDGYKRLYHPIEQFTPIHIRAGEEPIELIFASSNHISKTLAVGLVDAQTTQAEDEQTTEQIDGFGTADFLHFAVVQGSFQAKFTQK